MTEHDNAIAAFMKPPVAATKTLQVRMPASMHERLHAVAEERMVGAQLLVVKAIEKYLEGLEPVGEL